LGQHRFELGLGPERIDRGSCRRARVRRREPEPAKRGLDLARQRSASPSAVHGVDAERSLRGELIVVSTQDPNSIMAAAERAHHDVVGFEKHPARTPRAVFGHVLAVAAGALVRLSERRRRDGLRLFIAALAGPIHDRELGLLALLHIRADRALEQRRHIATRIDVAVQVQRLFDQLHQRIGHRQLQRGSPLCDRPHALEPVPIGVRMPRGDQFLDLSPGPAHSHAHQLGVVPIWRQDRERRHRHLARGQRIDDRRMDLGHFHRRRPLVRDVARTPEPLNAVVDEARVPARQMNRPLLDDDQVRDDRRADMTRRPVQLA
jgi:hypothetical protein